MYTGHLHCMTSFFIRHFKLPLKHEAREENDTRGKTILHQIFEPIKSYLLFLEISTKNEKIQNQ